MLPSGAHCLLGSDSPLLSAAPPTWGPGACLWGLEPGPRFCFMPSLLLYLDLGLPQRRCHLPGQFRKELKQKSVSSLNLFIQGFSMQVHSMGCVGRAPRAQGGLTQE